MDFFSFRFSFFPFFFHFIFSLGSNNNELWRVASGMWHVATTRPELQFQPYTLYNLLYTYLDTSVANAQIRNIHRQRGGEREGQREQKLVGVYIDIYVYAVDLWSQRVCARFLCNRQQVELAERWQGSVTGSVAGSRSGRVAPGLLCYRCWPSLALPSPPDRSPL